jgi:hypothetical protein
MKVAPAHYGPHVTEKGSPYAKSIYTGGTNGRSAGPTEYRLQYLARWDFPTTMGTLWVPLKKQQCVMARAHIKAPSFGVFHPMRCY